MSDHFPSKSFGSQLVGTVVALFVRALKEDKQVYSGNSYHQRQTLSLNK